MSTELKRFNDKFTKLIDEGSRAGMKLDRSRKSREWFRDRAKVVRGVHKDFHHQMDKRRWKVRIVYGRMYMYQYDPKHKETLPYYDELPLVFPIGPAKGGFYAINLHYLPPMLRAKLMDALWAVASTKHYDTTTKLKISYSILNNAAKFRWFRPCLKHYLYAHVRSQFIQIEDHEWEAAIMVPFARFRKAGNRKVWGDSVRTIMG